MVTRLGPGLALRLVAAGVAGWLLMASPPTASALSDLQVRILDSSDNGASSLPAPAYHTPNCIASPDCHTAEVFDGCVSNYSLMTGKALASPTNRLEVRYGTKTSNWGSNDLFVGNDGCDNCPTCGTTDCGCNDGFICSLAHGHPHYSSWALASLLDPAGRRYARGNKVAFAIYDVTCAAGYAKHFPDPTPMGISVGCSDIYNANLPCQVVDFTGLEASAGTTVPAGNYTFKLYTDPDNAFAESNESNNADTVPVQVSCPYVGYPCIDAFRCTTGETCTGVGDPTQCGGGTCGGGGSCGDGACSTPCAMGTDPSPVSWGAGRDDVFWMGANGSLWHMFYDDSVNKWSQLETLAGSVQGAPNAISGSSGGLNVFWRDTNDHLRHKWYLGAWSGDEDRAANVKGDPKAVWVGTHLYVFYQTTGNDIGWVWFNGSAWSGANTITAGIAGGSEIAAVGWSSGGTNHVEAFFKNSSNDLIEISGQNGSLTKNGTALGSNLTSPPVAVSRGAGIIDIFWRRNLAGPPETNDLIRKEMRGGSWVAGIDNLGGGIQTRPTAIAATSSRIDVYYKGPNNNLKHRYCTSTSQCDGVSWTPTGNANDLGGRISDRPVAVSWGSAATPRADVMWYTPEGFLELVRSTTKGLDTEGTYDTYLVSRELF